LRRTERGKTVFGAHGVAAPDDLLVRGPGVADLGPDLLFYSGQVGLVHAAELRGLVLDAEQDVVPAVRFPVQETQLLLRLRNGMALSALHVSGDEGILALLL
jgi:hypothetical protein